MGKAAWIVALRGGEKAELRKQFVKCGQIYQKGLFFGCSRKEKIRRD